MLKKKIVKNFVLDKIYGKTVSIKIKNYYVHPLYKKSVKRFRKYLSHSYFSNLNTSKHITFSLTRPISKKKKIIAIKKNL